MSAARFRKRPIEVEAICWNSQNLGSVQEFASGALGIGTVEGGALPLWVAKSSAVCRVEHGDWIIRETDGSGFYPCAADQFAATYEPADAAPPVAAALDRPRIDAPGSGTDDTGRDLAGDPERSREQPAASWRERAEAAERKLAAIAALEPWETCASTGADLVRVSDIQAITGTGEAGDVR